MLCFLGHGKGEGGLSGFPVPCHIGIGGLRISRTAVGGSVIEAKSEAGAGQIGHGKACRQRLCRFQRGRVIHKLHDHVPAAVSHKFVACSSHIGAEIRCIRVAHQLHPAFPADIRRQHILHIGAYPQIEGIIPLRVIVHWHILITEQLREGGIRLASHAEVHVFAAPIIGNAQCGADHIRCAPDLLIVHAEVHGGKAHSAYHRDITGNLHLCPQEHFKEPVSVVLPHNGHIAAAVDQAVEQICRKRTLQAESRPPFHGQRDMIYRVNGFQNLQVVCHQRKAGSSQTEGGSSVQHLQDGEGQGHDQLQRRHFLHAHHRVIQVGEAATAAGDPHYAASVNVHAGFKAAEIEVYLIGDGDIVVALEGQPELSLKHFCVHAACKAEAPVPDGVHLQNTLQIAQLRGEVRQTHLHLEMHAAEALTTAEHHIRHHDRGAEGGSLVLEFFQSLRAEHLIPEAGIIQKSPYAGGLIQMVGAPIIRKLRPVGAALRLGGTGACKAQIQIGGKGHHIAGKTLGRLTIVLIDSAHLAEGQIEHHTGQRLSDSGGSGPHKGDVLIIAAPFVFPFVAVIGLEGDGLALLELGKAGLAGPDGGSCHAGQQFSVKLHPDRILIPLAVRFGTAVVVHGHGTVFKIQAVIHRHAVLHHGFPGVRIHGFFADGGDLCGHFHGYAVPFRSVMFLHSELAPEGEQDGMELHLAALGIGGVADFPLCLLIGQQLGFAVKQLEPIGRLFLGALPRHIEANHRRNTVAIVFQFRVIGDGEHQAGCALGLIGRLRDPGTDCVIRPLQLQFPCALRQTDIRSDHHIHHIVPEGHCLPIQQNPLPGAAVFRIEIPCGAILQHGGIGQRHGKMPHALAVNGLGSHVHKAYPGQAAVTGRKQHIDGLTAQQIFLRQLSVGVLRVVDGHGQPLIRGIFHRSRLKIQGLCDRLAHCHIRIGNDQRGDGLVIIAAKGRTVLRFQRTQIAGAGHCKGQRFQIGRVGLRVVFKGHAQLQIGLAGADDLEPVLCIVVIQTAPGGHIDGHPFLRADAAVGKHAVEGGQIGGGIRSNGSQLEVQRHGAVCGQICIDGVGEIQRGIRRKIKQRSRQIVPVSYRDAIGCLSPAAGGISRNPHILQRVGSEDIARKLRIGSVQHRLCMAGDVGDLIIAVILIAQTGIVQDSGLHLYRPGACILRLHGNGNHAMLIGGGIRQREGHRKGQRSGAPHRRDGGVCAAGLGDADSLPAGVAKPAVNAAEDIVPLLLSLRNPEGEEGGIVISVMVQQSFVVVGFFQLASFHRTHGEAAVFRGNLRFDIAVGDGVNLGFLRCPCRGGKQTQTQGRRQKQAEPAFNFLHDLHLTFLRTG